MAKVLIDFYRLKDEHSGLGYFSSQLSRFILSNSRSKKIDLTFLVPKSFIADYNDKCRTRAHSFYNRLFPRGLYEHDIWHSTSQFPNILPRSKKPIFILTIHDLNFLFEKTPYKQKKYKRRLQRLVDRADVITAISHFTKSTIEEHLSLKGKAIEVVYNGVDSPAIYTPTKPKWIENAPFFFSIGYFTKKKNWESIIRMMAQFPSHKLVISGFNETAYGNFCKDLIKELNIEDRVFLSGKISNEEKSWLYANCDAFLFPSTAEGFGMPAVEAMTMGKPTFLSTHTSLPEIGGNVAFFFQRFDTNHMAKVVKEHLEIYASDEEKYANKIKEHAKKFNWQTASTSYLELYERLLSEKQIH